MSGWSVGAKREAEKEKCMNNETMQSSRLRISSVYDCVKSVKRLYTHSN